MVALFSQEVCYGPKVHTLQYTEATTNPEGIRIIFLNGQWCFINIYIVKFVDIFLSFRLQLTVFIFGFSGNN